MDHVITDNRAWVPTEIMVSAAIMAKTGTEIDAAIDLAAQALDDTKAVKAQCLYPDFAVGVPYTAGDRVVYDGKLYKVLQAHTSQADWLPTAAPSLFAEVLPGQGGTGIGEWKQPDSTNPYQKGTR